MGSCNSNKAANEYEDGTTVYTETSDGSTTRPTEDYSSDDEEGIFNSKMDRVMYKLYWLKKRAMKYKDKKSIKHIDWLIKTINDGDLNEPINKKANVDTETQEIIAAYSQQSNVLMSENDHKVILKVEKFMNARKSVGYQNFINKFKRKIGNTVKAVSSKHHSRVVSEIPQHLMLQVDKELYKVDDFEFNVYYMDGLIQKKSLYYILSYILNQFNYIRDLLKEKNYINFMNEITDGYRREVVYHNDLHAADVLQTTYIFITHGKLTEKLCLTDIDVMSTLIAAACHDFKHNGFTNTYHINVSSDIAVNYNDISVLENFHVSETFKIIYKEGCNLFEKLSPEQLRTVRRRMIDCILATDMANHASHYNALKSKLDSLNVKDGKNVDKLILPETEKESSIKNNEVKKMILAECVHSGDLGAPAKPTDVCDRMLDLVYIEFFNQGDKEKELGLPVSMLCDRVTTNIYKSQVGFIRFIVNPQFLIMSNVVPEIQPYLDNIQTNLKYYEAKVLKGENDQKTST